MTTTLPERPVPAGPDAVGAGRGIRTSWVAVWLAAALVAGVAFGTTLRGPDSVPVSDSVEVGFAQDMIWHHLQAVEMAGVALPETSDVQVQVLAYDIFTGQTAQIGQMQGWLALWGRPQIPGGPRMAWMPQPDSSDDLRPHVGQHDGGATDPTMAGMASSQELADLRTAPPGPQRDGLFLQLMLRHHQGGAAMLEVAASQAADPVVANFADQIASLQQHETDVMTAMMAVRGVRPLTP